MRRVGADAGDVVTRKMLRHLHSFSSTRPDLPRVRIDGNVHTLHLSSLAQIV
jgi:hypothetical protein